MNNPKEWQRGLIVRTKSGGAEMEFVRWANTGDAVCQLNGKTYELPKDILMPAAHPVSPRRPGRIPGISPRSLRESGS